MAAHARPRRRRWWTRRGGVALALVVLAGAVASAAASASLSQPAPTPLERQVQGEIDGMIAAGMSEDDPKVAMLRQQLAQMRTGDTAQPPREPGVDTGKLLAGGGGTAGTAAPATTEPAWQSGPVECEVVPGLLSAAEIAGAACASVPQPDGTSRYVAVGPDGFVRSVRFGAGGRVRRLADARLPAPAPPGTKVAATAGGDLRLVEPDRQPTVVDLR